MNAQDFTTNIEKTYHSHFPKSRIVVHSPSRYSIYIRLFLAGDVSELAGGCWENDMFNIIFHVIESVDGAFVFGSMPVPGLSSLVLENKFKSYFIKPREWYQTYSLKKLPFRKVEGEPEKVIDAFDRFCAKLKQSLQDDLAAGNVEDLSLDLVKSKLS
jgi:hypothetical protein